MIFTKIDDTFITIRDDSIKAIYSSSYLHVGYEKINFILKKYFKEIKYKIRVLFINGGNLDFYLDEGDYQRFKKDLNEYIK